MLIHHPPARIVRCRVLLGLLSVFLCTTCAFSRTGPESSPQTSGKADSILILKKDHVMELLADGKVIRKYKVALGQGGLAPKQRGGDGRTPEGHYVIDAKYEHSAYHKALHVS
jgi:murein L,D-transpeptidase YafK